MFKRNGGRGVDVIFIKVKCFFFGNTVKNEYKYKQKINLVFSKEVKISFVY